MGRLTERLAARAAKAKKQGFTIRREDVDGVVHTMKIKKFVGSLDPSAIADAMATAEGGATYAMKGVAGVSGTNGTATFVGKSAAEQAMDLMTGADDPVSVEVTTEANATA